MMLTKLTIPPATPAKKIKGYALPTDKSSLLSWEFVARQMAEAKHYWLNTVFQNGRPHAVPVWGIWHHNRFHFEGSPQTAWRKNLAHNPNTVVHTPSATQVVILHGTIQILEDEALEEAEWQRLDQTFQQKYQRTHGSPYLYLNPTKVLAWDGEDLTTMTRWLF